MNSEFDGGFKLDFVKDKTGEDLPYTVNKTMMRVDLPTYLKPGDSYTFSVKWWYNINNRLKDYGRSGYEYFEDEDNYLNGFFGDGNRYARQVHFPMWGNIQRD